MIPAARATYRLQLHAGFGFDDAAAIADYLEALGVSHVYASPYLRAARGSTHGYDVIDPRQVNPELGGEVGHARMCRALAARGLGQLLDIVPNHMRIGTDENAWWWDVLEHGRASRYARHFDVDWEAGDRIVLPILGERYADAIEQGLIRVERDRERHVVRYRERLLPVAARSLPHLPADGSLEALDAFLEQQHWKLGFWRYALAELGYRRFFDVSTLVGLRVEDPAVFEDVHVRVLAWLADGTIDGVRIDHVDGLRDPAGYLDRLRARAPSAWIVVEKILAPGESVPATWPVDGTTGYELARVLDGVFIDPSGAPRLDEVWQRFGGDPAPWPEQARQARLDVIEQLLSVERDRLVTLAGRVVEGQPALRDVTQHELAEAITELLASMPVYRTYVRPGAPPTGTDHAHLAAARAAAAAHRPDVAPRVWDALEGALLAGEELAMRFQQTTGAVMAKGIEDTLFYRNLRFAAQDEVGGAPERFGVDLDELHRTLGAAGPRTLIATATHDTKRGEDVRARLAVLSELADGWAAEVTRWSELAGPHRTGELPDGPTEYLIWQTLVGAWPISRERMLAYVEKAAREAKRHTSWLSPDAAYEAALARFVDGVLADPALATAIDALVASITPAATRNSLARTLLKLTAPGVPDLYQGTELWDRSLVDPDNRRPVDYARRRALLARARDAGPEQALAGGAEGLPKLWLIHRVLHLRRLHPEWFEGSYRRLEVRGAHADRVIAFARGDRLVVLAPRFTARPAPWGDTVVTLPAGAWLDVFSSDRIVADRPGLPLTRAWKRFPVALLARRS